MITSLSILVLTLAIMLRGLVAINKYKSKYKSGFSLKEYFDIRHTIRWFTHLVSSVVGYLVLPEGLLFLEQYVPGAPNYFVLGTGIVGYVGYDLIRWLEQISLKIIGKVDSSIEGKVTNRPEPAKKEEGTDTQV